MVQGEVVINWQVTEIIQNNACVGAPTLCAADWVEKPLNTVNAVKAWINTKTGNSISDPNIMANGAYLPAVPTPELPSVSNGYDGPVYNRGTETLFFPSPSENNSVFKTNENLSESTEIVAHEYAHHVQNKLNSGLEAAKASSNANQERWARAIGGEGSADVIAALYEKSIGRPDSDAWKIMDDVLKSSQLSLVRDGTAMLDWDDWSNGSANTVFHDNGKILLNMFYRMQQAGATNDQLIKLVVDMIKTINITTDYNESKFKTFLDTLVAGAMQTILDMVWDEMVGSGGGGGGGVPSAPGNFTTIQFVGCNVYGQTVDYVNWSDVSGADYYKIYWSNSQSMSNPVHTSSPTTSWSYVWTSLYTVWAVKACNENGCSNFGPTYLQIYHWSCQQY